MTDFFAKKDYLHTSTRLASREMPELREAGMTTLESKDKAYNSPITNKGFLWELSRLFNVLILHEANKRKPFTTTGKLNRWNNTCLLLLPNIRKQRIEVTGVVESLKAFFGVSWKLRRLELWGWRSRHHNKYLRAMYQRLSKARKEQDLLKSILVKDGKLKALSKPPRQINNKYWNLAYFLATHSTVLQVVHANKVLNKERTWPGRVPLGTVLRLMQEVTSKLRSGKWMEVRVRRVWIDDAKRPLGVPSLSDRVIGSIWSNLIEFYLWDSIKYNHGYQAGKGSGTAWYSILTDKIKYPHIWEYDLDGCFNRLSHDAIGKILRAIGLPSWMWMSLMRIQKRAPLVTAASGGKVRSSKYGNRILEIQEGKSKKFLYWDAQSHEGVAQGHSLSPLISLIVIEHAVRSYMARDSMKGSSAIGYADDGLFFTTEKFDVGTFASFIRNWGMYLSRNKCAVVREDFNWLRSLKFLGLLYNPFREKLQAQTRKGSEVVLESSKSYLYKGDKLLAVEDGIFVRENPYDKLGDFIPINDWVFSKEAKELCVVMLIAALHPTLLWLTTPYLVLRGWLVWWIPLSLGGVHQLIDIDGIAWLLIVIGVYTTGVGLPTLEIEEGEGVRQQITWRLVVKAGKLNAFIARLYNKSLADKIIPQEFKLEKRKGSLLWHLSNTMVTRDGLKSFEKFLVQQGLRKWNWLTGSGIESDPEGESLLRLIEKDLDSPVNFANATTVGCYLLIDYLSTGRPSTCPGVVTNKSLHRRLLDKFHLNGYWWHSTDKDPWNTPAQMSTLLKVLDSPTGVSASKVWAQGRRSEEVEVTPPKKLHPMVDWLYLLTKSWLASINQNRHRWVEPWPNMEGKPPFTARRVYRQYRPHAILGKVHGFVPVIRKKYGTTGKPPATNHKYSMVVPVGGTTVFEIRPSLLFTRPKKTKSNKN